jgi:poly-gamma-glutamate synthesis protein (capsule biosynthesis protein)
MFLKQIIFFTFFFLTGNSFQIQPENIFYKDISADISYDNTVSLLFAGDIMGHGPQIQSAFNLQTNLYSYDTVFHYIKSILSEPDFTIANLEVTLAGEPYTGYPQFSSPDALVSACKNAGIDFLVTANNHCCDRGLKGINRTIDVLDSLQISHTGTFKNIGAKDSTNLRILEKNDIKIGLLNYTYGTNGIPVPEPAVVNLINTSLIKQDIDFAKKQKLDQLIVFLHFGNEYESMPNHHQTGLVSFLFDQDVDIVIGSHPHVIQNMLFLPGNDSLRDRFVSYSLGNFVSNQRKLNTDGGVMAKIILKKENGKTRIEQTGYILTWVYKKISKNKRIDYFIIPAVEYENKKDFFDSSDDFDKMTLFLKSSRALLDKQNKNVPEFGRNMDIVKNEK